MNKALFLDRDGVINVDYAYVHRSENFEFIDGIFELCLHYQQLGYLIFVVTNQSGIARGYYSEKDFLYLSTWMVQQFEEHGVSISKVYFCPHHEEISGSCSCRKPEPGMLLQAQKEYDLDLENSILVGDSQRDIEAAARAGVKESYLFDKDGKYKDSHATKVVAHLDEIWKK